MLIAYCDGGCNNKTKENAYGSFLVRKVDQEGEADIIVHHKYNLHNCSTSNEAEYEILICLLEWLLDNGFSKKEDVEKEILIYSDSKLMVNQVNGGWQIFAENLISRRDIVMQLLKLLGNIKLLWVARSVIVPVLGH